MLKQACLNAWTLGLLLALDAYLAAMPEASNRAQVEARARVLRNKVKSAQQTLRPRARAADALRNEQLEAREQREPRAHSDVRSALAEQPCAATAESASRAGPWVTIASGAALTLGGGVLLYLGSTRGAKRGDASGAHWGAVGADAKSVSTLLTAGSILVGVGLASAAAGTAWLLMGSRVRKALTTSLAPKRVAAPRRLA